MKPALQEILCRLVRLSGLPLLIRETVARRRVTVINYHDPMPERFAEHLAYFARHYCPIDSDTLAVALQSRDFSKLPPKALLVTLDDGHAGNFALRETVRRLRVPVTIYAVAGVVGTRRRFWFKQPGLAPAELTGLKAAADSERRALLHEKFGFADDRDYPDRQGLTIAELHGLRAAGAVIGSHTMSHPLLTRCPPAVIRTELLTAKQTLGERLGCEIRHFAYPGGDWNAAVKAEVAAAGYLTARTIAPGFVTRTSDPLALPNFGIADDASLSKAILQATGIWSFVKCRIRKESP